MTRFIQFSAAVACIATAGMAAAQSSTDGAETDMANGKAPDQLTCADIVTMDTAVVPGTLYYVAGYKHGSGQGGAASAGDSATGDMAGTNDTSGTDDMSATDDTAGTSDTDTMADEATSDTEATADTDATSDTDSAEGTDTGTDTAAGTEATGDGALQIVKVSGFYEIPVEKVITVCNETPDKNVSDVLDENRDEGAGDTGGTETE